MVLRAPTLHVVTDPASHHNLESRVSVGPGTRYAVSGGSLPFLAIMSDVPAYIFW